MNKRYERFFFFYFSWKSFITTQTLATKLYRLSTSTEINLNVSVTYYFGNSLKKKISIYVFLCFSNFPLYDLPIDAIIVALMTITIIIFIIIIILFFPLLTYYYYRYHCYCNYCSIHCCKIVKPKCSHYTTSLLTPPPLFLHHFSLSHMFSMNIFHKTTKDTFLCLI